MFTKCAVMAFKVMRCLIVFAEPGEGEWVGTSADLDAIGGGTHHSPSPGSANTMRHLITLKAMTAHLVNTTPSGGTTWAAAL